MPRALRAPHRQVGGRLPRGLGTADAQARGLHRAPSRICWLHTRLRFLYLLPAAPSPPSFSFFTTRIFFSFLFL